MTSRAGTRPAPRARAAGALVAAALALGGCGSMPSWTPSMPSWVPFFGADAKKLPPLPAFTASFDAGARWQYAVGGRAAPGLAPAVTAAAVLVAGADGQVAALEPATGQARWRTSLATPLSAGIGSDGTVAAVGTAKGEVIALDAAGARAWSVRVSSEVVGPPVVYEGNVVVFSGDGRIFGLDAKDGQRRWVFERSLPALIVRNYAGGIALRGGVFVGTAGGRLVAVDVERGLLGWEAPIATPKGATELERIADVTSRPVADDRQVCAAAFQGRTACYEILRGTLLWSRDIASAAGLALDARNLYVTDDAGAVHALDRATGASVWKQDKLAGRRPSGPAVLGPHVAVVDAEGWVHVLSAGDGALVGRVATDGSPPVGQPVALDDSMLVLTRSGTLYRIGPR